MIADWVPAHRRLMKGPKKAIPRGVRFVLLELSLEARPTRGVLDLPVKWETLKAVHDLIGGNRREIRAALKIFQEPDESGHKTIEIVRDRSQHRLTITKWELWAGPKSSTDRVREHRKNKALAQPVTFHDETNETPTGEESTNITREGTGAGAPARAREEQNPIPESERADAEDADEADERVEDGETGYDLARRIFFELWKAKYGGDYELAPDMGKHSEDRVLQRIGALAKAQPEPEAYLRHKIRGYLKDRGARNYLDERKHPLRTIERDWTSYGVPKARRASTSAPAANGAHEYKPGAVAAGGKAVLAALDPANGAKP